VEHANALEHRSLACVPAAAGDRGYSIAPRMIANAMLK